MNNNRQPYVNPDDTFGKWMLTIFVSAIPIIGFIMLLVWGFGSNPSGRRNYARATLMWQVIGIVAAFVFFMFVMTTGAFAGWYAGR